MPDDIVIHPPLCGDSVTLRDWEPEDIDRYRHWLRPHHEWHAWDCPFLPEADRD